MIKTTIPVLDEFGKMKTEFFYFFTVVLLKLNILILNQTLLTKYNRFL